MSLNKTIRLRTIPGSAVGTNSADTNIQFKIEQEFNTLDILSLKITQADAYRNFCSDYGVVVGRVIANDGFGVQNAKVSIFIPLSDEDVDRPEITTIYPYRTTTDTNGQGIRYNLLSKDGRRVTEYLSLPAFQAPNNDPSLSCSSNGTPLTDWTIGAGNLGDITYEGSPVVWQRDIEVNYGPKVPVGTFPSKSDILDNDTILEVYDKYYKFTTTTNSAGDYMLFGVPVGVQTIHMDVDLSDTGNVSLSVQDFINAGFPQNLFDGNNFKSSTNLDALPQIESRDTSIDVIPFWGNLNQCEIGITRLDFNLNKTVIPSAALVFHSFTNIDNYIKRNCGGDAIGGGNLEDFASMSNMQSFSTTTIAVDWNTGQSYTQPSVGANTIIKVPMSRDRYITNEFGDYILSPDQSKGIPTSGDYTFYINPTNQALSSTDHRASYVFPNKYRAGQSNGPEFVRLKYDLDNKQTRYYTLGNRNFGDTAGGGQQRLCRIHVFGGSSVRSYPISAKDNSGDSVFGRGYTCFGSLYFPRFEISDGDVCGSLLSNGYGQVSNAASNRMYSDEAIRAETLLDVTFLMKKFQAFGGELPISSHSHNIGTFNSANVINPDGFNNLDLENQTYPLKNNTQSGTGSIGFPKALNDGQNPVISDTIIDCGTYFGGSNSACSNQSVETGTRSLVGRYFFYFGLTNSNNILKYIKDNEDV